MSPAAALGWEFGRRHRWGWAAVGAYFVMMIAIKSWAFAAGQTLTIEDDESFGLFVMGPLSATLLYTIVVFTFGFSGDIAARESMFPARLLRLPISTSALTWWPMLLGAVTIVAVWFIARSLLILPPEFSVPVFYPAVLGVAFLGWAQAAIWMPYGMRGARIVVTALWLVTIDAIVIVAYALQAREWVICAIIAPQIPVAWLVARNAVARARRGDVPDWGRSRAIAGAGPPVVPFGSAARAQLWFEWRRHGLNLPALVAMVIPFELALFFTTGGAPSLIFLILLGVLVTPAFLAKAAGATVSRSGSREHELPVILATRPLRSGELVGSTLRVTVASTIITWSMVAIGTAVAMMLSGTWAVLTDRVARSTAAIGAPRTAALMGLIVVVLVLSTWRQLVQSLYVGLTGREWLAKANVFGTLFLLFLLLPFMKWTWGNKRVIGIIWDAIPVTLFVLAALKTVLAIGVYRGLSRRGVMSDGALLATAGLWCAMVLALYATFVWFWDTTLLPRYVLALIAIMIVPLVRISAAPLAFDWNRHR
jgi:hypothetical protein